MTLLFPKISIVTPSYNQGKFIEDTIRSVVLQRYPNLEYIIMDGGSTDDSVGIIKKYSSHISFWVSEKDAGQADAIKRGFEKASGDIYAYLNSDDILLPGTLEYVAKFFSSHQHVDALYSNRIQCNAAGKVTNYWILPPHSNYLIERWDLLPQETCFWRSSLYRKVKGIDPSFHFAMDYDFFVRAMRQGKFRRVKRFLASFRMHEESKTRMQLNSIGAQEIRRVQEKNMISFRFIDEFVGSRFRRYVVIRSNLWVRCKQHHIPSLPGVGYTIDDLWSGALGEERKYGTSEKHK